MASIAKLVVTLGANTAAFETDMQRAAGISKRQMAKMERDAKRLNEQWTRNFKIAGAAVAAGLVIATKAAIDFESAMSEVATLGTGDINALSDSVKRLSVEFGQAPVDQAKALYQVISAGFSEAADSVEVLTVANKLAVGGLTTVSVAADGLTSTLNAYSLEASEAGRVSDIFFNTMKQGKTTIPEISAAIGNVATIAFQAGVSLEELGAATALVTKQGQDTSRSMDGLRGVLSAVLKQSKQTQAAAKDIGIEFDLARLKTVGLAGVLQDIADSGATADQLSKLVGRVEGLTNALSLVKDGGRAFAEELRLIQAGIGATDDAVAVITKSTKFLMQQLSSVVQVAAISFGEKLLPAIQSVSRVMILNFDKIVAIIESLVAVLVTRLAIAGVAALNAAAAATTRLAVAMAIVGGPIGLLAIGIALLVTNLDRLQQAQGPVGDFIRLASRGFVILGGVVQSVAAEILNLAMIFINTLRGITAPATVLIKSLATAISAALSGDFAGAADAMMGGMKKIKQEFTDASDAVNAGLKAIGDGSKYMFDAWEESKGMFAEAADELTGLAKAMKLADPRIKALNDKIKEANKWLDEMGKSGGKAASSMQSLKDAIKAAEQPLKNANKLFEDASDLLDELIREFNRFGNIADRLYPMEAATRNFHEELAILRRNADEATWSAERLAEAEVRLAKEFRETTQGIVGQKEEISLLATAIDEGVRIMERAFTDMWSSFLDGANMSFKGVADGFKTLLASLVHQASTQKIMLNIQDGMKNGFTPENMKAIGEGVAAYAGVILGSKIGGGGERANTGAAIGSVVGGIVGSYIPVIGTMLGSFLGAIIGGFIGGLFKKGSPVVTASGNSLWSGKSGSDDEFDVNSIFGKTFITSRRMEGEDMAQMAQGIKEFDNAIGSFLDDDQIGAITDSLANWTERMVGEAISLEDLLDSRFSAIMETFSEGIQNFVADGEDLAARVDRLQVGVAAEKLFADNPNLMGDRSLDQFLAVVEAFQHGTMSMAESYNVVLGLLGQVQSALDSLSDYSSSDLGADFKTLMDNAGLTLAQSVAGIQSALMDAINGFDGSPDQLTDIANLAILAREGELKLLSQIDGIQKAISSNLATLRAEIAGLGVSPLTDEQLFNKAGSLFGQLSRATTAEEVADLAAQFESTIRQMSPESQLRNQSEILRMIDDFDREQNRVLEVMKQAVIDSGESMRTLVDTFLNTIGPALEIIAGTNTEAAAALDILANGGISSDGQTTEEVLETGMVNLNTTIGGIGPVVANALRQALAGYNVNVSVNVDSSGLVTQ